jgi:large subunit ribosomal protein L6
MSRVGRQPVAIPQGVSAEIAGQRITLKGKLGTEQFKLHDDIQAKLDSGKLVLTPRHEDKRSRVNWGTSRALLANLVTGVSKGFVRTLQIEGTGFRAAMEGKTLSLQLGFSHEVKYPLPTGIGIKVIGEKANSLEISGTDKRRVGQVAAELRGFRKPEPYKGKGIRFAEEKVRRKEGKKK